MFRGSCVALVTPMTQTGAIDKQAFEALVLWHLDQGTDALVIGGTTGESVTLDLNELSELFTLAVTLVKASKNPIPVIAGAGSNNTEQAIEKAELAKQAGCDGLLIVTPYYNRPTQEGLYLHYKKIAQAIDLPIILYNVPTRTGCDLLPATAARLSYIPNIIGIKDATGDLDRIALYTQAMQPGFKLYTGDDGSALEFIALGGDGVISVAANVMPKAVHELCWAIFDKNMIKAKAIDASLKKLYENLSVESNPIPVKWALNAMGKIPEGIRLPLTKLSESHHEALKSVLQELGVLDA